MICRQSIFDIISTHLIARYIVMFSDFWIGLEGSSDSRWKGMGPLRTMAQLNYTSTTSVDNAGEE